jgi:hypothetical protein
MPGILLARTYAICQRSKVVPAVLGFLALGLLIPNLVCDHTLLWGAKSGH